MRAARVCYDPGMTFPWTLPDWLPWWALLIALVPLLIYALLVLLMPFSVFGVKDRLELLDARLDEIQGEIRQLTLRLGEPARRFEDDAELPPRPPIPPRQPDPRVAERRPSGRTPPDPDVSDRPAPRPVQRPRRAEPRLDWPR